MKRIIKYILKDLISFLIYLILFDSLLYFEFISIRSINTGLTIKYSSYAYLVTLVLISIIFNKSKFKFRILLKYFLVSILGILTLLAWIPVLGINFLLFLLCLSFQLLYSKDRTLDSKLNYD